VRVESTPRPYNVFLSDQFEAKLDAPASACDNDSHDLSYEDGPVSGSKLYDWCKVNVGHNDRKLLAPQALR